MLNFEALVSDWNDFEICPSLKASQAQAKPLTTESEPLKGSGWQWILGWIDEQSRFVCIVFDICMVSNTGQPLND
jgi:hypothetical protein